jgi:hypothetical protein
MLDGVSPLERRDRPAGPAWAGDDDQSTKPGIRRGDHRCDHSAFAVAHQPEPSGMDILARAQPGECGPNVVGEVG